MAEAWGDLTENIVFYLQSQAPEMYTEAVFWAQDKVAKEIEMRLPSRAVHTFIFAWDLRTWFGLMRMTPLIYWCLGVDALQRHQMKKGQG